jgi:hypothetical protein
MDAPIPEVQSRPMKRICCLATAAALAAAAAAAGCQNKDRREPSPNDPPTGMTAPSPNLADSPAAAPDPAPPAAPAPPPSKEYAADIEKLCDVVRLAGVEGDRTDDRLLPIANWLAANLTTAESRQFLVRIQPMADLEKADALDAEARRVGLAGCNLAGEWRSPP